LLAGKCGENLTLQQLRIFKAVVKTRSITKAARELRISQPSISKQLKLLEDEFGVKFHVRVGQGIELTDEGQRFWTAVYPILDQIGDLKSLFNGGEKSARSLALGVSQSPSASLAPAVLKAFGRLYPEVSSVIRTSDSRNLEQLVLRSEIELALVTAPSNHPEIVVEPVRSQHVTAFVSFKHAPAKKSKLNQDELDRMPFIIKMGGRIDKLLKQQGRHLNIAMQCESSSAVKSAVESGLGIGLLPRDNVEHGLNAGYFKSIKIPWLNELDFKCFVIYRIGLPLSPNAENFLALLRRWPEKLNVVEED
jgi:LysR family transcriptional regulator, transcriptional activator of the cysJI operon